MKYLAPLLLLVITLSGCGGGGGGGSSAAPVVQNTPQPTEPVSETPTINEQLASLDSLGFDEFATTSFELLIMRYPEWAVSANLDDAPLTLNDLSPAYEADTLTLVEGIYERLQTYTNLTSDQAVVYGIYDFYLGDFIDRASFEDYTYPASWFLTSVPSQTLFFFDDLQPLATLSDAEDYVTRLAFVDQKIDQLINKVTRAESNGIVMPRLLLDVSINRHQQLDTDNAQSNPYYTLFFSRVNDINMTSAERDDLLTRAETITNNEIAPAYRRLVSELQRQRNVAPDAVGVGQYVGGQDYYQVALRHHTTTDLTPDEIHELGLQELDRIHAEMRVVFDELGYPATASIVSNLNRTATDSGSVPANQVVTTYEAILDEAEARLPEAFDIFPQAELIVVGGQQGGFYIRPALDGSRPGAFHATNTSPEPRYLMKSLAYHEGVPGHHTQIAIAQELGQTIIQQQVTFTGFAEGWALYAESLAGELGWYDGDPHGDLGRLQYEAFRAARLVVDTGIHARGWSFNQAATFFHNNTGFSIGASENQIARYAIWPGQATAYMVGMLEILRVRTELQNDPDFDLIAFHRSLLTRGSVPLTMLGDGD